MENISSEDSSPAKKYVAFFDLDLTITAKISGKALVAMAWKKHLVSPADIIKAINLYFLYRIGLSDPQKVIDVIVGLVRGKSEAGMNELCEDACREVLLPAVYSEAIKAINFHRENKADVVILSSAPDHICAIISESLGMDGYIGSSLEAKAGFLTGRTKGKLCFGEEKLHRMNEYCKHNTMNPDDSWYYADSISDLSVLKAVGRPVCVNPDRQLKSEAKKRGWKIMIWNH